MQRQDINQQRFVAVRHEMVRVIPEILVLLDSPAVQFKFGTS